MIRMRSISAAFEEIKASDPNTALTPHSIRKLILDKKVSYIMSGSRYLVNLDALEAYLNAPPVQAEPMQRGVIRRINA